MSKGAHHQCHPEAVRTWLLSLGCEKATWNQTHLLSRNKILQSAMIFNNLSQIENITVLFMAISLLLCHTGLLADIMDAQACSHSLSSYITG